MTKSGKLNRIGKGKKGIDFNLAILMLVYSCLVMTMSYNYSLLTGSTTLDTTNISASVVSPQQNLSRPGFVENITPPQSTNQTSGIVELPSETAPPQVIIRRIIKRISGKSNEPIIPPPIVRYIIASKFSGGETTDFSSISDYSNIEDLTLHVPEKAKIKFLQRIDLSEGADFDKTVFIRKARITVDADSLAALQKPAHIVFYDLDYKIPPKVLMSEGSSTNNLIPCPPDICTNITYDIDTGTLEFDVSHFTTYALYWEQTTTSEFNNSNNSLINLTTASDEVKLAGTNTTGYMISELINLPGGMSWDKVEFTISTPGSSSLIIDVLNSTNSTISGYSDISNGTDISGISENSIRLKATLQNGSTPVLYDWKVLWSNIEAAGVPPPPYVQTGYVLSSGGAAINNASVNITNLNTSQSWTTTTDSSGFYAAVIAASTNQNISVYASNATHYGTNTGLANLSQIPTPEINVTLSNLFDVAPGTPIPLSPAANATVSTIYPTFSWTIPTDDNNDSLHFKLELATDSGFVNHTNGSPFESNVNTTGFSPTPPANSTLYGTTQNYTLQYILEPGIYWWRVSAWDGTQYGSSSTARNFTMDTVISIEIINDTIDLGTLAPEESNEGIFVIQSNSNVFTNVTIHATNIFTHALNPSNYYLFKSANNELNSAQYTVSSYSQIPNSTSPVLTLGVFNYSDLADLANITINTTIPADEPPGLKNSIVTFTATYTDSP